MEWAIDRVPEESGARNILMEGVGGTPDAQPDHLSGCDPEDEGVPGGILQERNARSYSVTMGTLRIKRDPNRKDYSSPLRRRKDANT